MTLLVVASYKSSVAENSATCIPELYIGARDTANAEVTVRVVVDTED